MLRGYQQETVAGIKQAIRSGHKRILVVSPTGSGKSFTIAYMLDQIARNFQHALVLVHRREIIFQLSQHLDNLGREHGIILAGEKTYPTRPIQIGSIQTFTRRYLTGDRRMPRAEWVIIDEAHLSLAKSYTRMVEQYEDATLIGFTATPVRGDGAGLGHLYDELVLGADIEGLIEDGYLVPTRVFAPTIPDLTGVKVRMGDYVPGDLEEAMDTKALVGDAVENWKKYAPDRKTVVFTTGVGHSLHICEAFRAAGVQAEHLDGTTDHAHREKILRQLTHGDLQVVTNCDVLTTGWDAPAVSCMVMVRPTKSYGLYLQMAGRILRPHPGKENALIIDHAGNVYRHGFPEDAGNWSLDEGEKIQDRKEAEQREREPVTCRNCYAVYTGRRDCPECGWVATPQSRAIDVKEGRLNEVKRKPKPVDEKQKIWNECLWKAIHNKLKCGAAAHMYRKKTGVWPRGLKTMPSGDQWQMSAARFYDRWLEEIRRT